MNKDFRLPIDPENLRDVHNIVDLGDTGDFTPEERKMLEAVTWMMECLADMITKRREAQKSGKGNHET